MTAVIAVIIRSAKRNKPIFFYDFPDLFPVAFAVCGMGKFNRLDFSGLGKVPGKFKRIISSRMGKAADSAALVDDIGRFSYFRKILKSLSLKAL